ncbi:hypothetical protein ACYJ1Y_05970 [Natrialbaceae archaeon A-gly3]
MQEDDRPRLRSTSYRRDTLEDTVVGFAALAVLVAALGGAYTTAVVFGGGPIAAVAAVFVGLGTLVAVPLGAAGLVDFIDETVERRTRRRRDRDPGTEPEPGPVGPDPSRLDH